MLAVCAKQQGEGAIRREFAPKMAEEGGGRTHQARHTRLTGFEVRAPHRGAILLHNM